MNSFSPSQSVSLTLLALIILSLYGWDDHDQNQQAAKSAQLVPEYVFVQVSGKVRSPGIYSFDQTVNVSQAVARAGGLIPPLRPSDQLAWATQPTEDSSRILITADPTGVARFRLGWMAVPTRMALGVPVDINTASVAELSRVPGISYKSAEAIVALRVRRGGFSQLENLREVKGIGPATITRLRQYLKVGKEG